MATPSPIDIQITHARKFLLRHARPSTVEDLIEANEDCEPTEEQARISKMLVGVLAQLRL